MRSLPLSLRLARVRAVGLLAFAPAPAACAAAPLPEAQPPRHVRRAAPPRPPAPTAAAPARPRCIAAHVDDSSGMRDAADALDRVTWPVARVMMPPDVRGGVLAPPRPCTPLRHALPAFSPPRPRPDSRSFSSSAFVCAIVNVTNLAVRRERRVRSARMLEFLTACADCGRPAGRRVPATSARTRATRRRATASSPGSTTRRRRRRTRAASSP